MGPWRPIHSDGPVSVTLVPNPYAWNLQANLVFLEQPVGVGFSYQVGGEEEGPIGDKKSVSDFLTALTVFFTRFPERKSNDLYLASESYGGHYIPELAQLIFDRSDSDTDTDTNNDIIHLKKQLHGLLIGNPFVSFGTSIVARGLAFWNFQVVPQPLWMRYETEGCANMNLALDEFSENCWDILSLMFDKASSALDICKLPTYPMEHSQSPISLCLLSLC
jgi:carboxypeptidase C (cathepsin A)